MNSICIVKRGKTLSLCGVNSLFFSFSFWLREVRIDLVRTSTILLHVRLVPKIQPASCYIPKIQILCSQNWRFTTRALLSRNYNARENSLQLPNPYTRNPPSSPEPKGPLVQIGGGGGTFVTHPTFWTNASLSHASPPPIAPFSPFEIPGRHNLSAPAAKPHPPPSATSPLPSQILFPDDVVHRNSSMSLVHLPG